MIKFSEFVSLGHPDKVADYISQYVLDRYIERDPQTRYAVEAQIKGHRVTLGGEVSSTQRFSLGEYQYFVREAVKEIGYTREYQKLWGNKNAICGDFLQVDVNITHQSQEIARGVKKGKGWGDQGIFFGMATPDLKTCGMPLDHTLAKRICRGLFVSNRGGIDIKSQVVMDGDRVKKVIVAIPLLPSQDTDVIRGHIREIIGQAQDYEIIVNGTGSYVKHSSIADCGTTGRKLAVDFYGGNCLIGGGSPWTKDASKADLTLNLVARHTAKAFAKREGRTVFVSLACCIGRQDVDLLVQDDAGNILAEGVRTLDPLELRAQYRLDTPIYASMCRWGLFGEYQQDKAWEVTE